MTDLTVVIGAGSIGQAIARRVSAGKHVLLADLRQETADAAAKVLNDAGFEVTSTVVDVSSRDSVQALVAKATSIGDITGVIHAAGVSPSQAAPATILLVDLYGTLPMLQPEQVTDPLNAYQISKRGNSLRVAAEAVRWGKRGARVNTISPGIIFTPLARDELNGPRGDGYRRMIESCSAKRGGTPDEVAAVAALLMGPEGTFITGSDFLMDGGVTAQYWYGSEK